MNLNIEMDLLWDILDYAPTPYLKHHGRPRVFEGIDRRQGLCWGIIYEEALNKLKEELE